MKKPVTRSKLKYTAHFEILNHLGVTYESPVCRTVGQMDRQMS